MNRVLNSSKYLKDIVLPNQRYFIGFGISNLTDAGREHPILNDLISGRVHSSIITGKSGVLKENTYGKFVKKKPWSKNFKSCFHRLL